MQTVGEEGTAARAGQAPVLAARAVCQSVAASAALREELQAIAAVGGRSERELNREAARYLRELVPDNSPLGYRALIRFSRFFYQRGYDREIRCDPSEVERLRQLVRAHSVALVSNHRSQVDGLAIFCALHDNGLPHPFAFGGINMKLPVMGQILKRSGMVYMRRSFQDNRVYRAVLKAFLAYLAANRQPLLWAIEGTRSRTGKLAAPRFGLMSWVLEAGDRTGADDLCVVPVAVSYEQIADVQSYSAEQRGAKKNPESFRWLLRYLSKFETPLGPITIRFGEPVSVREELERMRRDAPQRLTDRDRVLRRIVIETCIHLNDATPVTAPSLVCLVLLQAAPRAVTRQELEREFTGLVRYVGASGWPATFVLADDHIAVLDRALATLVANHVVECFDRGRVPVYSIVVGSELAAAYYRNNSIHFFIPGAMAELALAKALAEPQPSARAAVFRDELQHLRQLFKFEFYFRPQRDLESRIHRDLDIRCPGWSAVLASGNPQPWKELHDVIPLLCHGVLECFLDAYQVVAGDLAARAPAEPVDENALIDRCLGEAEQLYRLRRISHPESVAKPLLESALLTAKNRGLLPSDGHAWDLAEKRRQFLEDIKATAARIQLIRHIASVRRSAA